MKFWGIAMLAAASLTGAASAAEGTVDVQAYVKPDKFNDIKISPNGEYYAATIRTDNLVKLVIISRADNKFTATLQGDYNAHVADFWWVSPKRVMVSLAQEFGSRDQPSLTGELYGVDFDGSHREILIGQRTEGIVDGRVYTGGRVTEKQKVMAYLTDSLPADDRNVIVSVRPFSAEPFTQAERLDVYNGKRTLIASAPVARADFATDNKGVVRFAQGAGADNASKLYYRDGDKAEWKLINDENVTHRVESAVGFSADDKTAYLWMEQDKGPDSIVALDIASNTRKEVLRDDDVDPSRIIYRSGTGIPLGAFFMDGKPRTAFFDNNAPEARLYRGLEKAFPGEMVRITSQTSDGRLALVEVSSDRNPGDFYLFDTVAKKADQILSRRNWFNPAQMASMQPVRLSARDGLALHGYLTVPKDSTGKNLPLVVMPHGGPFGRQDNWGFDSDVQLLANAGYAVLQVNFRGSSGYGRAFTQAGARQWGGTMQDDLTDATRWAIQQGIADAKRICIYGASYGGYASLMGVAKEPDLYRCAVGYVGVYDLPLMQRDDGRAARWAGNWSKYWVGEDEQLVAASPNRIASRIKAPVFLAAGGKDERAPIEHSKKMESALKQAGVLVETLYYDTEGHGFYTEEHQQEFYTRLLTFLDRHIGGALAVTSGEAAAATAK